METSLHHQLKHYYAADSDAVEVTVDGFRIDAIDAQGGLVEIQYAGLGALRSKARKLLDSGHALRVVKPWIGCKWIETYEDADGPLLRRRKSPKKLNTIDIFRELLHFTQVFPHPNLTVEVLAVDCIEQRVDRPNRRWKRKQYKTLDLRLVRVDAATILASVEDLWRVLGEPKLPKEFDTKELGDAIEQPRWFAQQIAYTLNRCGATEAIGKRGNAVVYRRKTKRRRAA